MRLFDGDEAAFIAADCFLDLDAARALRDAATHLPQRMMPTAAALVVQRCSVLVRTGL
jgi:hypothetical protein